MTDDNGRPTRTDRGEPRHSRYDDLTPEQKVGGLVFSHWGRAMEGFFATVDDLVRKHDIKDKDMVSILRRYIGDDTADEYEEWIA